LQIAAQEHPVRLDRFLHPEFTGNVLFPDEKSG